MSLADLVHRNGLGSALCRSMNEANVSPEGGDAAIDAAPDLLIGEEREEALDLVEP
jgi:hypothetical protein